VKDDRRCYECIQQASRAVHCDKCGGALFSCIAHFDKSLGCALAGHRNFDDVTIVVPAEEFASFKKEWRERGDIVTKAKPGAHNLTLLARPS
jgi:hypothetical protein